MTVGWARRLSHVRRHAAALGARVALVEWDEPELPLLLRAECRVARLSEDTAAPGVTDVCCDLAAWPISSGALSGVVLGGSTTAPGLLDEAARTLEPGGLLLWTPCVGQGTPWERDDDVAIAAREAGFRVVAVERLYADPAATERRTAPGMLGLWWERKRAAGAASARLLVTARRDGGRASALAQLPGMGESLRSMFVPRWPKRRRAERDQPWQKR